MRINRTYVCIYVRVIKTWERNESEPREKRTRA